MTSINWEEFFKKFNLIQFGKFDMIVAIANGGIIPAAFIQEKLKIPMDIIYINYRDELLKENDVKSFLINGDGDFSLFNEQECLKMPWK